MKKQQPYKAVPLADTPPVAVSKIREPTVEDFFTFLGCFFLPAAFFALIASLFFGPAADPNVKYHRFPHYESHHPTKLSGGGRDWLVNAGKGTIHAKHNPSLVLGVSSDYPLVLVKRGSPQQLLFGPPPKNGSFVPFQDVSGGVVIIGQDERLDYCDYREASLSFSNESSEALVSFQQDNFIVLENVPTKFENDKWFLDVKDWVIKEGESVRFVDADSPTSGGGRDFYWEANGIISTKLNPDLVLGRAGLKLVLVEESSPNKLFLDHVKELANGEKVPMTWADEGVAVGKRYNDTREYGPWYYIESEVKMESLDEAIDIWYDGNFIFVDGDESLVLDVQFWEMEPGTPVNFVGGGKEEMSQSNQDKEKPSLRAWSTPNESIVTSSTSDESPSISLEGERPPPPASTSSSSSSTFSSSSSEDSSSSSSSSQSSSSSSSSSSESSSSSSSSKSGDASASKSSKSSKSGSYSKSKSSKSGSPSKSKSSKSTSLSKSKSSKSSSPSKSKSSKSTSLSKSKSNKSSSFSKSKSSKSSSFSKSKSSKTSSSSSSSSNESSSSSSSSSSESSSSSSRSRSKPSVGSSGSRSGEGSTYADNEEMSQEELLLATKKLPIKEERTSARVGGDY